MPAVRRSCQLRAGPTGSPVAASQTMVEPLWFVTRDARDLPDFGQASARHFQHGARDRGAVKLDKAGEGVLGGQVDLSFRRERPVGADHARPHCAAAYVDHEDADGWPLSPGRAPDEEDASDWRGAPSISAGLAASVSTVGTCRSWGNEPAASSHWSISAGWPGMLGRLAAGQDLTSAEAAVAMREILDGTATASQIAAFIFGLRCKGETSEELTGMLQAMLEVAETVPLPERARREARGHLRDGRRPGRDDQCLDDRRPRCCGSGSAGLQARWPRCVVANGVSRRARGPWCRDHPAACIRRPLHRGSRDRVLLRTPLSPCDAKRSPDSPGARCPDCVQPPWPARQPG